MTDKAPEMLAPCPFCGKPGLVQKMDRCEEFWISCEVCTSTSGVFSSPESAIAAWNTRIAATRADAGVKEALEMARKRIEYFGTITDDRHGQANETYFLPPIDAALAALQSGTAKP